MLIVLMGESCVGKSTLAHALKTRLDAKVYTGKDYRRLAKNEDMAKQAFRELLSQATHDRNLIWAVSEKEDLALVPEGAVRILMTEELEVIRTRFAARMGGSLPKPVAAMLERKHGCFDREPHDYHVASGIPDPEVLCDALLK